MNRTIKTKEIKMTQHENKSDNQNKDKGQYEHETYKKGQRQGGLDKKGEREKDKKGEF